MRENWIGRSVGEVHIERLLSRGGRADVYLGKHGGLNRRVAITILHEPIRSDPAMMRLFRAEADALTGIRHPNIVRWRGDPRPGFELTERQAPTISRGFCSRAR